MELGGSPGRVRGGLLGVRPAAACGRMCRSLSAARLMSRSRLDVTTLIPDACAGAVRRESCTQREAK